MGKPKTFPKVPLKVVCVKAEGQREKSTLVIASEEDAAAVWSGYEFSTRD